MALTDKLTDIADAIRAKTGESDLLTLDEMPDAIAGISGGGGEELPDSMFNISGTGDYLFANNRWQYLIEKYPARFNINLTGAAYLMQNTTYKIPSNLVINSDGGDYNYVFNGMQNNDNPPYINITNGGSFMQFFGNASFKSIPQDYFSHIALKDHTYVINISNMVGQMDYLHGIINFQTGKADNYYTQTSNSYNGWPFTTYGSVGGCGGAINIPVITTTNASMRATTVQIAYGYYIRRIVFSTNNGVPYTARMANITINLSGENFGRNSSLAIWTNADGSLQPTGVNANLHQRYPGLTDEEILNLQIYDAASYNRLKNNPDAFTLSHDYSLYNRISAIETINSLPDTSAYGTNTIKFRGAAGALTDGGAINTMTAEEIAVATAKGWTVSFV